jgi:hypothetical protein
MNFRRNVHMVSWWLVPGLIAYTFGILCLYIYFPLLYLVDIPVSISLGIAVHFITEASRGSWKLRVSVAIGATVFALIGAAAAVLTVFPASL